MTITVASVAMLLVGMMVTVVVMVVAIRGASRLHVPVSMSWYSIFGMCCVLLGREGTHSRPVRTSCTTVISVGRGGSITHTTTGTQYRTVVSGVSMLHPMQRRGTRIVAVRWWGYLVLRRWWG